MPLDLARSRSMPLDFTPSGNTAIPLVGLNYCWKGDPAIMETMTYASLAAIVGWAAVVNKHPIVPEVEFTPLDLVALGGLKIVGIERDRMGAESNFEARSSKLEVRMEAFLRDSSF
jgi:hypothetical protein